MIDALVTAAATAFAASAAAVGVAALLLRRHDRPVRVASTVLVTAAVVVGMLRSGPLPALPPHSAAEWPFWLVVAAGLLGAVDLLASRTRWRFDVPVVLALTGAWLILERLSPHRLSGWNLTVTVLIAAAVTFVVLWLPAAWEARRNHALPRSPWVVALTGAAATIGWSGSARLGGFVAVVAGACAGAWMVLAAVTRTRPAAALRYVPGIGLMSALVAAWGFAALETHHALLLAGSALCVLVDRKDHRSVAALGLIAAITLAGIAAWQAHAEAAAQWPSMFGP